MSPPRPGAAMPVLDPLRSAAAARPDAVALETEAGTWRYGELDLAADRVAVRLARDGVGPGDRVALDLGTSPAALVAIHGVPRTGAAFSVLHPGWTPAERRAYLELLDPAEVLDRPAEVPGPESTGDADRRPGTPGPVAADAETDGLRRLPGPEREGDHSLVATSGTTGGPRAVRLTLAAHLASARGSRQRLELDATDRWLASLSLAHVGGLALVLRAAVMGCRVLLRPGFDAEETSRLVDEGRVTHASLVPVMLRRLLDARNDRPPPDTLRCLLVGGDATPGPLLERALAADFPVALTYGLTEACSQVCTAPPELVRRHPGTAGRPLPGTDVRTGDDGEILVRGPTLARGYLAAGGDGPGAAEEPLALRDGWLHTGDTGRLDGAGRLWVSGRLSDRIVTGGATVDPASVEAVLAGHPGVRACAVVGVEDPEWGERVVAAVVPEEAGTGAGGAETEPSAGSRPRPAARSVPPAAAELEESLAGHCRQRLSAPRRPRQYLFLHRLPRNPNGKPDRGALRRRAQEAAADGPGTGTTGPVRP